jgi:acyl carrier protein
MEKDDIQKRVIKVTVKVLKMSPGEVKPDSNFVFDLGADSMQSVELVAGFDEEFGIEMDEEKALAVQTVSQAVDFIQKYVK